MRILLPIYFMLFQKQKMEQFNLYNFIIKYLNFRKKSYMICDKIINLEYYK